MRNGSALDVDSWGGASGEMTYVLLCEVGARVHALQRPFPCTQPMLQPTCGPQPTAFPDGETHLAELPSIQYLHLKDCT